MSNVLRAFYELVTHNGRDLRRSNRVLSNRINAEGDSLEDHLKNAFAEAIDTPDAPSRLQKYNEVFSWTGNSNNPPDFMVQSGDAVEVKKIKGNTSQIQLNSSYPKKKLIASDPKITEACRSSESWQVKDLLYCVGSVNDLTLNHLWMVYGDCFVADAAIYERLANAITDSINETGLEIAPSNELARVNQVDPLGVTALRVRGMWIMQHPARIFRDYLPSEQRAHQIYVIMTEYKYGSFDDIDRQRIEQLSNVITSRIQIPSPDNPANILNAVCISGEL